MAQRPRELSPAASPLHFFGAELRFWREKMNLSQDALGALVYLSGDTLAKVEKAQRVPSQQLAVDCDAALGTGGALTRLWLLVDSHRKANADKASPHVDNPPETAQAALTAGTMALRIDEEGNVWGQINRRSFLVGSAGALAAQLSATGALPVPNGRSATTPSDDPYGFGAYAAAHWPELQLARSSSGFAMDWHALIPGGRAMLGASAALQVHPAEMVEGRAVVSIADQRRARDFLHRPERGLLIGAVPDGEGSRYFLLDGRTARSHLAEEAHGYRATAPTAYELDDLTYGILWAVSNYDDALQADDQALHETRNDLAQYARLSSSAVSREAAPGLNPVAHMWLGSDFCARHILKALPELPALPAFWTREQRGEEASAWLVFDHKYPYLRETTRAVGAATTRAFCVPERVVRASPQHERILLFLAVALMESMGIHAQFTDEHAYEQVEGFVVAPQREAIIANWVRGDGMWHVDVTGRTSTVREFSNVAQDVSAHSIIEAPHAGGRLRALAHYLDLPWAWLIQRCAELGRYGTSGLIQSRSRLVSPDGLDAALSYVGALPVTD